MTSRSWIRKLFARPTTGTIRKAPARKHLAFEALEDRLVPANSLVYQAVDGTPLTLRLAANNLEVVSTTSPSTVLASESLSNITEGVRIEGVTFDVNLTIDATVPIVPGRILFDGGSGTNRLLGANTNSIWHLTGAGTGDLGGPAFVQFTHVEGLVGSAGADTFAFANGAGIPGSIAGGGGLNTLNYAAYDAAVMVNLGANTATGTGGFSGIGSVVGGGSGADNLVGPTGASTWNLAGVNAGSVGGVSFTGVENLSGGAAADTFVFANGAKIDGGVTGGGGLNTLDYAAYETAVTVNLGAGGFSGIGSVIGGKSLGDTLAVSWDNTWTLTGENAGTVGSVSFTSMENLTGAAGNNDTFLLKPAGRLSGRIDGGVGGSDRIVFDDGNNHLVTYAPTGSLDGTVAQGGRSFAYVGLEPIQFYPGDLLSQFGDAGNVTIIGNPISPNDLSLTHFTDALVQVSQGNGGGSIAFHKPAQSLTITLGGVRDNTLSIGAAGAPLVLPGSLILHGGLVNDSVVLAGALTLGGGLSITRAAAVGVTSSVIFNGALTIQQGGLLIDDRVTGKQTVAFNAPASVRGDVTILGGLLKDTVSLNAPLDITGGDLVIDATVGNPRDLIGDALLGLDTVTLGGAVNTHGGDITVDAATVSVGPVTLSTRQFNAGDPSVATGDAGSIRFDSRTITIGAGGKLLATGGNNFAAGDITLSAYVFDPSGVLPVDAVPSVDPSIAVGQGAEIRGGSISLTAQKTSQTPLLAISLLSLQRKKATIDVTGATIDGSGDVAISATTEDADAINQSTPNLVNNLVLAPFLSSVVVDPVAMGLPPVLGAVSYQDRSGDSRVSVTGSTIHGAGDVRIESHIDILSSAKASGGADSTPYKIIDPIAFVPFSAGYAKAEGSAQTLIGGTTSIDADGSVTIGSNAKVTAEVQSFTASNVLFGKGAKKMASGITSVPAIAIAVTESDTTSNAIVGKDVHISARGNVTVRADGDVTNNARAGTAVFGDGLGSVGFVLGRDKTTILSRIDGHITAGGVFDALELDLSRVDAASNTIRVPDHGLTDGQSIVYHAADPSNPDTTLPPIGGLADGATYYVIVRDKDTIQLARAPSTQLDASGIGPDVMNSLSRRAVKTAESTDVSLITNTIALTGHGFAEFQKVTVVTTADWTIQGLQAQGEYAVHVIDADHFQLLTQIESNAGAMPQLLPGTTFYIADLHIPPPADPNAPIVTPKGTLILGYTEAQHVDFNATAVQNGGTIEIAGHGLQTGDVVNYSVVQGAPTRVTVDRTALLTPIDFDFTFNPRAEGAGVVDNTIVFADGHQFATGQRLTYSAGVGGTPIGGLSEGGVYYAIVVGAYGIQLASSLNLALNGTFLPVTSSGGGTAHVFRGNPIDVGNNLLVIRDHQLQTGQQVTYNTDGGAPVGGLTPQTTYYVIRVTDHLLRLALTRQAASAGNAIDLSAGAGGSRHALMTQTFVSMFDAARAAPVVDYVQNTIELPGHQLATGDQVRYDPRGGDPIGGLARGLYSVLLVDADHIRLALTTAPDTPIDLLPLALDTGLQEFSIGDQTYEFDPLTQPAIDAVGETIWMRNHGFVPGQLITYLAGGGTAIGGLIDGHDYLVLAGTDSNNFRLADPANPQTPLDLTGPGTGFAHGFERASTADRGNSPIRGLRDGGTYYVTRIDADHIRLSETEEAAQNAGPIDLSLSPAQSADPTLTHYFFQPTDVNPGVNVLATLTAENRAITDAQVGGTPTLSHMLLGYFPIDPIMMKKMVTKQTVVASPAPITVSGSVALNKYVHLVQAVVGAAAVLQSDTDVTVEATSENFSQVISNGKVLVPRVGVKAVAVAAAVALGTYDNTVRATVEGGASIDATDAVTVASELSYPDLIKFLPFNPERFDIDDPDNGDWMTEMGTALNGRGGLDQIFNVWAQSSSTAEGSKAAEVSVTGSAGTTSYKNVSEATIGAGARINDVRRSARQSVSVTADTTMTMLNLAGVIKLELDPTQLKRFSKQSAKAINSPISPFGNQAKTAGVGGSFLSQTIDSTTVARIASGARVHTGTGAGGGLTVRATENVSSVNLAQSGGSSGVIGLSGSVSVADHVSNTLAELAGGIQVHGGPVEVGATSDVDYYNVAGAAQTAGAFGIGASAAVNRVTRDTEAFIGTKLTAPPPSAGSLSTVIDATGLTLEARNTGLLLGVAVAGTVAGPTKLNELASGSSSKMPLSVGVSGAVGINEVHETTRSYINDTGAITLAQGELALDSASDTRILAVTGSLSLAAKNLIAIALAGSFSQNTLVATTEAFVVGADVQDAGAVRLQADRQGSVFAVTVAAAGPFPSLAATGSGLGLTFNVAASVSLNSIGGATRAFISDGSVQATGPMSLAATDSSRIQADGGGVAIALGLSTESVGISIAAGASVAVNQVTGTVEAYLDDVAVSGGSPILISATNSSAIEAVTVAGAAIFSITSGLGLAFSGAGAGSGNTIHNTIRAYVQDSDIVQAGSLSLTATDDSRITADAVALALALQIGSGGIGTAVSMGGTATVNEIENVVEAFVDDSTVSVTGSLAVRAIESSNIFALSVGAAVAAAIGGQASLAAGVAGSFASNDISNTVSAHVTGSTALADGSILVQARDTSTIFSTADGGALGVGVGTLVGIGIAVGIAIAENTIANQVLAYADDSTIISSTGGVVITSTAENDIDAIVISMSISAGVAFGKIPIGIAVSGSGARADNTIQNTVEAAVKNGATVIATGDVRIAALDTTSLFATVVSGAFNLTLIGFVGAVSITNNLLENHVAAYVDGSQVVSGAGALVVQADASGDVDALAIAVGTSISLGLAAAGARADSAIRDTVEAYATNATLGSHGATRILAGSDLTVSAETAAATISTVASVSVLVPEVHIGGATRAFVDGASTVTSNGLDVHATSRNTADLPLAMSLAISVLASGGGAGAHSTIDRVTEAYVGADTPTAGTVVNAGAGKVSIEATSTSSARSDVSGGSFAAINIGAFLTDATINGATRAYVGPRATVYAGSLDVHATANERATAGVTAIGAGIIGGNGANAAAAITSVTEAFVGTRAGQTPATPGANLVIQGAADIAATTRGISAGPNLDPVRVDAHAGGGSGGGLEITTLLASAHDNGRARAYVGEKSMVQAGSLAVEADGTLSATAHTFVIAVGLITGTGAVARADVGSGDPTRGTVEAYIGTAPGTSQAAGTTTIRVSGAVGVTATSDARALANSSGGTGDLVGVSAMLAQANENTRTHAHVGKAVDLRAGALNVAAIGAHRQATSSVNLVQISLLAGGGGTNSSASVNGRVEALAGGAGSLFTTAGDLVVRAESADAHANASTVLGAGGLINVAVALADADNRSTTSAELRDGTNVSAGRVAVLTDSKDRASANALVAGGGAISGQGVRADAAVAPTNTAFIGNNVRIASAGDVEVTALARTVKGTANASSWGGGLISVGVGVAEVTVTPTVNARIGSGTTISAGGKLTVAADLRQPQTNLDDTFVQSSAVDTKADTIRFEEHGLQTGEVVVYDAAGQNPINTSAGPLVSLTREYPVIRVDDDTLSLGETFAGTAADAGAPFGTDSGVDAARDVISFGRPHGFKTGDAVRYNNGGSPSVGGLTEDPLSSGIYYVRVIDDRTIKLTRAAAAATAPLSTFTPNPGLISGGDTLHIANSYLAGDRVSYRSPSRVAFNSKSVDYDNGNTEEYTSTDNNIIFLGADADGDGTIEPLATNLRTGDKVTYFADDPSGAIGGLVSGQSYYVIKLNDFQIRLAATAANAASNTPILLSADKSGPGTAVRHLLVPQALGGLRDGVTYTVFNPTGSSFQLRDAAGNLVTGLSVSEATGTHFLSKEGGIDLTATAGSPVTSHSLRIDFTGPTTAVTNKLLGRGQISLRVLNPTADGPSSASANGGAFGFAAFIGPTAHATFAAKVQASSAAALLDVAGDVAITSHSGGSVSALADGQGGGFVGVGAAKATVDYTNTNNAFVGTPVGDINGVTGEAASPQVTAAGVRILAGGDLLIGSESEMRAYALTFALGAGFIGAADATSANHLTSHTNALVGSGADIRARSVAVNAQVAQLEATAKANATAGGFAGGAGAEATNDVRSTTNALLEGTVASPTHIEGREGVDVHATHERVVLNRATFTKWYGLFGGTSDRGSNTGALKNTADGDVGVHVIAAQRPSAATSGAVPATPLDTGLPPLAARVAVFVQANNGFVALIENGELRNDAPVERTVNNIRWDSDITVYAGPSPELIIGPDGRVVRAVNVTVNGVANPAPGTDFSGAASIRVGDIQTQLPSQIVFQATNMIAGGVIVGGHHWGTFHFSDGYQSVRITNASDKELVLGSMDLTPPPSSATRVLLAQPQGASTLTYDTTISLLPTVVDVRNLGASDLVLPDGQRIDNPTGETRIVNLGGAILTGPNGTFVIRTHSLGDPLQPTTTSAFPVLSPGRFDGVVSFTDNGPAPDTITRNDGVSWLASGFQVGHLIQVEGDHNAGVYKIAAISGASGETLTLHVLDSLVTAAGFATVTRFSGIEAGGGSIGSAANPVRIVIVKGDGGEHLYAAATGDVFIRLTAEFDTDDPANTLFVNTITAGGDVQLTLDQVVDPTFVFGLIEAGGDIRLQAADAGIPGANGVPARVNIRGIIDLLGSGHLDVLTNGDVELSELTGDLRAGSITSTAGDVALTAPGSIIDALADAVADVTGVSITLTAQTGSIGVAGNDLDIDSSNPTAGLVTATAPGSIYLNETAGDMNVAQVLSQTGDVRLIADRSILDGSDGTGDAGADVLGNNLTFVATRGSIGASGNDLEIDSAFSGAGVLNASAAVGIYLTETRNDLSVVLAAGAAGDVRLTVPDANTTGQDLHVLPGAQITAGGSVTLRVGDNVDTTDSSVIRAGANVSVYGDYLNADAGTGTVMDLRGSITPGGGATHRTAFFGNTDNDTFTFNQTFLGGQTFAYGSAAPTPAGGTAPPNDGEDTFVVNQLKSMASTRPLTTPDHGITVRRDTLDLDGQAGTDSYAVHTTGSASLTPSDYVINALDTGANGEGADVLSINGSDAADLFLLRRADFLVGRPGADSPAFVALLHGTAAQAMTHTLDPHVERINYDTNINGRLLVSSLGGDDSFASDDNSALTTLDGGAGNDVFQIGQLFGTARVAPDVAPEDQFDTTLTTRGHLSRGVSFATTANGGLGDDTFSVYSNKAALNLNGDDGNDSFTIRAFALADQSGASAAIPVLYNVNASVAIDGGNGLDQVAVLGTEFGDNLVITDAGVYGAGLNAAYVNVETLEVNGMEGDDTFFMLSTSTGVATTVVGHLGADTHRVAGDVTLPIVSTDDPTAASPLKSFPLQTHVVSQVRGPLAIEGSTGGRPDRALVTAVILPTETDTGPHSLNLPPVNEANSIDRLNVFNDSSAANDVGTLTGTTLTGLGSAGGITYRDVEILDVLLGTGNDTFTINGTMTPDGVHGGITVIHGGAGGDTIAVRPAAGSAATTVTLASPLVIYGDTSQDGSEYNDVPGAPAPYARHFAVIPGNNRDTLDASASLSGVALYGGLDNDVIFGSQVGDYLAGGGGGDRIHGNGGGDIVYGDSGFNAVFFGAIGFPAGADRNTRDVAVPTVNASVSASPATASPTGHAPNSDDMAAGHDTITGDSGADTLFGDHGIVTQATLQPSESPGTLRLVNPGAVTRIETTQDANGVSDNIDGGQENDIILAGNGADLVDTGTGHNIVFGDSGLVDYVQADGASGDIDLIQSLAFGTGDSDTITSHAGDDILIGGAAADLIDAGNGSNLVIGDSGRITAAAADTPRLGRLPITLGRIETLAFGVGGADTINTGDGRDVVLGGHEGDTITVSTLGATGATDHNIVLGDDGFVRYDSDLNSADIDEIASTSTTFAGGSDTITSTGGDDLIIAGRFGDNVNAGDGKNIVIGDSGQLLSAVVDTVRQLAGQPMTIGLITTVQASDGGDDQIATGSGQDIVLAGTANDTVATSAANDVVLGDNGLVAYVALANLLGTGLGTYSGGDNVPADPDLITAAAPNDGGSDVIRTGTGSDLVIAGTANDTVHAGAGNDLVFGDHGEVRGDIDASLLPLNFAVIPVNLHPFAYTSIFTRNSDGGGRDLIYGDEAVEAPTDGDDILIAGQATDTAFGGGANDDLIGGHNVAGGQDTGDDLDGGTGVDMLAGDNAIVLRTGSSVFDIYRLLNGPTIYDANGVAQVNPAAQPNPGGALERYIRLLDHSDTASAGTFGDDYLAGGAGDDRIFGELGDDVIQGDGSILGKFFDGAPVSARRAAEGSLVVTPSFEAPADGNDYIEGGGGSDVIFGNLGQDDLIGGSSLLFGLTTPAHRPDEGDLIFGGAGTNITRNDLGDAALGTNDVVVTDPTGHARDADVILGDNGNVFRLVGAIGQFLQFNYDQSSAAENRGTLRIIPRAPQLLDYTPGGPDFSAAALNDIGAADEAHGEAGDDFIYGMVGSDVLFGDGQDDDIVGGYGNDWISGGTGQDGVIGDDGRVLTSRNGTAEPLNGVTAATAQAFISTPGSVQQANTHVSGQLKKAVDLTPFSQQPDWTATADEWGGESKHTSDDVIYGGLGSDFLHGGSGDDAISGAEALPAFFAGPVNPGDVLGYGRFKASEFASYDEFDPLRKIGGFLLNFDPTEGVLRPGGATPVRDDGDDKIFGDLGNDWLVGGTGRDNLYGGWGDDLLNADDNHDSTAATADPAANNVPDTHPTYEDRAYGGAGRDVLIANTGGDRLMDWVGEFNSYLVPFAPFGLGTVSRTLQPQLAEFLYALSASDGADPTRAADTGADPARNGEPFGELGVVRQQDFAWQEQTGGPADPQAGNIPGGPRDVLRSASFDNGSTSGFFADSGAWKAAGGVLEVQAESLGRDAASVFHVGDALPTYFELRATVQAKKATAGWKSNSYMIFDYQGKNDFKFAGLDVSSNKLVIGRRTAAGWVVDKQATVPGGVKADTNYNLLLAINGLTATLVLNNQNVFTHTYAARVVDGYSYGLNWGLVGVGSDNSRGKFDNVAVQILPPQITLSSTEDFNDGVATQFGGEQGTWQVQVSGGNGRYAGTPPAVLPAGLSLIDLGLPKGLKASSYLEVAITLRTAGVGGVVFDQYGPQDFKFAAIDARTGDVVIGHSTKKRGWAVDARVARGVVPGADYELTVTLKGTTASVLLNGQVVLGHSFNATTVDGKFGLLSAGGVSSFDAVTFKTDDPAFATGAPMFAAAPAAAPGAAPAVDEPALAPVVEEAVRRWLAAGEDAGELAGLRVAVANLPGLYLGQTHGTTVYIDHDAAGHGWFIDPTPWEGSEFVLAGDQGEVGRMDLLTVVMHEIGRVLGRGREDTGIMQETLEPGTRVGVAPDLETAADVAPPAPSPAAGSAVAVAPDAGEVESSVADDARVQVDRPAPVPIQAALDGEESVPSARPVRRGTGAVIAPDLGVGTAAEVVGTAPVASGDRATEGRPPMEDAPLWPPSIADDAAGVEQLIGWVPRRKPLQREYPTDVGGLDDLWVIDLDGRAAR